MITVLDDIFRMIRSRKKIIYIKLEHLSKQMETRFFESIEFSGVYLNLADDLIE